MSIYEQIPLHLYLEVVRHAGEEARRTGDRGWTALFIFGVAVGVGCVTVTVLELTRDDEPPALPD